MPLKEVFADPKDSKLPIGDEKHLEQAITALQPGGFRGNKAQFDKGSTVGAKRNIAARINQVVSGKDKKKHLQERLAAIKSKELCIAPRPFNLYEKSFKGYQEGIAVFKGDDGLRYMVLVSSNSYKDREDEALATKTLQRYVKQAWSAVEDKFVTNNVLKFWHDSDPVGNIVWADTEGPFLIEVAKELPNRRVRLTRKSSSGWTTDVKTVWDMFEHSPKRLGASLGFLANKNYTDKDNTFGMISKFETSVLPLDMAANPYTFAGVVHMGNKDTYLEDVLKIPGFASRIRKGIGAVNKDLKQQGLKHKSADSKKAAATVLSVETKGIMEDLSGVIDDFLGEVTDKPDPDMKNQLMMNILGALANSSGTPEADPSESGDAPIHDQGEDMPQDGAAEKDMMGASGGGGADDGYEEKDADMNYDDSSPQDDEDSGYGQKEIPTAFMGKQLKMMDTIIRHNKALAERDDETRQALSKVVKALNSLDGVGDRVDKLEKSLADRLQAVEKRLGTAPRGSLRASQHNDTELPSDKQLLDAVQKQVSREEELFPGSGVKIKSYGGNNGS